MDISILINGRVRYVDKVSFRRFWSRLSGGFLVLGQVRLYLRRGKKEKKGTNVKDW